MELQKKSGYEIEYDTSATPGSDYQSWEIRYSV